MKVLFVHQNFPGQFGRLAARLAADPSNRVVAIGESDLMRARGPVPGVTAIGYPKPKGGGKETHHYLRRFEGDVRRGQAAVRAAMDLKKKGFVPDVIYGNPGWGEMLFLKDVYPTARHVALFEFFFRANEGDHGFDPELPVTLDDCLRLRMRNTTLVMSLDVADRIVCPTQWQASRIPAPYQPKVAVVHDGIDTALCRPDASAVFEHPAVPVPLRFGDEVLTYVARNLEPYRGFHWLMRALPKVLAERPQARVVIVGEAGDDSVLGGTGNDSIDGRAGNDTIHGNEEVDIIFGDEGADLVYGGTGSDVVMGERGGVSVTGGNDTLYGDLDALALDGGADTIDGDAGNDIIYGGGGGDIILGDNGNDTIEGGAGADIMGGSAASAAGIETTGNDTFVYRAMTDAGDLLYGFDIRAGNSDTIELLSLFATLGYGGTEPRTDGYLRVQQSDADALVQIDANGLAGGASFTTLVTLIDRNAVDITDAYFAFFI